MKVWKIIHVPSGLFYQPRKGRWTGRITNLGPRGKLYEIKPSLANLPVTVNVSDSQAKKHDIAYYCHSWSGGQKYLTDKDSLNVLEYELTQVKEKS